MNENICWFCRENVAQEQFMVEKTLYDLKSVQGGSFGTMRAINIKKISIPRCKNCAGIQKRINFLTALYLFLLIVIPVVAGFLGYQLERGLDIEDLSIYIGAGAFVLGLVLLFPYIKLIKSLVKGSVPYWSQLPEIKEWLNQGWSINNPG
jgi:hypothetical protein